MVPALPQAVVSIVPQWVGAGKRISTIAVLRGLTIAFVGFTQMGVSARVLWSDADREWAS